jgi:uncharacterized protein
MSSPGRPVPVPDPDDGIFWSQLPGRLMVPGCDDCGYAWMPPIPSCPRCGSVRVQARDRDGHGTVYSWVVVHHALDPAFAADVPYTVVTVELQCGARLNGRLLGAGAPRPGLAVRFEPWPQGGGYVPAFRPTSNRDEEGE